MQIKWCKAVCILLMWFSEGRIILLVFSVNHLSIFTHMKDVLVTHIATKPRRVVRCSVCSSAVVSF